MGFLHSTMTGKVGWTCVATWPGRALALAVPWAEPAWAAPTPSERSDSETTSVRNEIDMAESPYVVPGHHTTRRRPAGR